MDEQDCGNNNCSVRIHAGGLNNRRRSHMENYKYKHHCRQAVVQKNSRPDISEKMPRHHTKYFFANESRIPPVQDRLFEYICEAGGFFPLHGHGFRHIQHK